MDITRQKNYICRQNVQDIYRHLLQALQIGKARDTAFLNAQDERIPARKFAMLSQSEDGRYHTGVILYNGFFIKITDLSGQVRMEVVALNKKVREQQYLAIGRAFKQLDLAEQNTLE